ncbi:MAG: hypothetical protein A2003_02540 [Acinetobacter sp. GWC1_38_13]|uniref:phage GP46 family protein n=1 Tax=Acinetobacter sp. GWC1_38_13 TaxID=1797234 RepID=UPI0008BE2CB2|nr:phage GP46 family protein [Acinetobacter sp. GWC1_38_13]OFW46539.1 MAG: hypothetical protein A2003_02540 [Acinetobacter sp. GWC1_38_13]
MAEEIKLSWSDILFEADMSYLNGDLESEAGFASSVLISLFTDRRALNDDELPDSNSKDKRGWWGDLASPEVDNDRIGSRLWLLERSKTIPSIVTRAKQYVEESLQWMIEDGMASKIEVETERQGDVGSDRLAIGVKIHLISGTVIAVSFENEVITIITNNSETTQIALFGSSYQGAVATWHGAPITW